MTWNTSNQLLFNSSVGGQVTVNASDASDYAQLPTPPFGKNIGHQSNAGNTAQNIFRTSKVIKLEKDGTIRQVGSSVHEKVDDINDTFLG